MAFIIWNLADEIIRGTESFTCGTDYDIYIERGERFEPKPRTSSVQKPEISLHMQGSDIYALISCTRRGGALRIGDMEGLAPR